MKVKRNPLVTSGLYDERTYIRQDKEARDEAKRLTREFVKAYLKDPKKMNFIDNHYIDKAVTQALENPDYIITSKVTWTVIQEAYPEIKVDEELYMPAEQRTKKGDTKSKSKYLLKDFQIEAIQEFGSTIIKNSINKEKAIKEVKARTGLDVTIRPFRQSPEVVFSLIETPEVAERMDYTQIIDFN